jgi:hypothetical protein
MNSSPPNNNKKRKHNQDKKQPRNSNMIKIGPSDRREAPVSKPAFPNQQRRSLDKPTYNGLHQNRNMHRTDNPDAMLKPETIPLDPSNARAYSVSVALPGSIVANAQSPELKAYLAGQVSIALRAKCRSIDVTNEYFPQIARALVVFNVDEVIIFNDDTTDKALDTSTSPNTFFDGARGSNPNLYLCRILQYLETPQYLRKQLFPIHRDLSYAGLLNPLDAPHHLRVEQKCKYREGVTVDRPTKKGGGSLVNIGFKRVSYACKQVQRPY